MKNILYITAILTMFTVMFWTLFTAASDTWEIREAKECKRQMSKCYTGSHCKVGSHEFLTITARGTK